MNFSPKALELIEMLDRSGCEARLVGGCVRDVLMGREPGDWDICVACPPEKTVGALCGLELKTDGMKYGGITALYKGEKFEITSLRREKEYADGRRPRSVEYTDDLEEDLKRRDFTVNAMAWKNGLFDPFGGQKDLEKGVLRTVGDPFVRLREDPLRILRGIRFMALFGLRAEKETDAAIKELAPLCAGLSPYRIKAELFPALMADCAPLMRRYPGVFTAVFPELRESVGFYQKNEHHIYDVWSHITAAFSNVPPDLVLRLAVLFHDSAKPACCREYDGQRHFKGHCEMGAEFSEKALLRLGVPKALRKRVAALIAVHDLRLPADYPSAARIISLLGEDARLFSLFQTADNLAQNPRYLRTSEIVALGEKIEKALEKYPSPKKAGITPASLLAEGCPEDEIAERQKEKWLGLIAQME